MCLETKSVDVMSTKIIAMLPIVETQSQLGAMAEDEAEQSRDRSEEGL